MISTALNELRSRPSVQSSHSPVLQSLLIADDDHRYRHALKAFLEFYRHSNQGWFQQIYEADQGSRCIDLAIAQQPSLILLDLEFLSDNQSGIDIFEQLKKAGYRGKVAFVSGHNDARLIFKAMKAGACGYLLKDRLTSQLPEALPVWARDRVYLGDEVTSRFFSIFHHAEKPRPDLTAALTSRETEVLQLLVNGASNQDMAKRLYITAATVKAHLTSIFNKLHVSSRTQAIVRAVKMGLVVIEETEFEER